MSLRSCRVSYWYQLRSVQHTHVVVKLVTQLAPELGQAVRQTDALPQPILELERVEPGPVKLFQRAGAELVVEGSKVLRRRNGRILFPLVKDAVDIQLEQPVGHKGDNA